MNQQNNSRRGKDLSRSKHRPTLKATEDFVTNKRANISNHLLKYTLGLNISGNYHEWYKKLKEDLMIRYPKQNIFGNEDQEPKVTAEGATALQKKIILTKWTELYKRNYQFNEDMKNDRIAIFHEILGRLSIESRNKIESEPRYLGECYVVGNDNFYNPFKLLALIRDTHIGFTGANFINIDVARSGYHSRLASMSQGNDDLLVYANKMIALRDEEKIFTSNNPISRPTAADPQRKEVVPIFDSEKIFTIKYMSSLNHHHSEAVNHYRNRITEGKPVFNSIMEAYQFVSRFATSKREEVLTLFTKAKPENHNNKGNRKDRNMNSGTNLKDVKNLKDCWMCKKLKVSGNIKHFYPDNCPSEKIAAEICNKKRKRNDVSIADANAEASNVFLENHVTGVKKKGDKKK
jgi:hypothetical protein